MQLNGVHIENWIKEAELSVLKAIELKPDFAMAHANLGTLMKNLGNLQKAKLSILFMTRSSWMCIQMKKIG